MNKAKDADAYPHPWKMWDLMGYAPNRWALEEVHSSLARFNTYCTCRQCGKSVSLAMLIHEAASKAPDVYGPPLVGVLTPDFKHTDMVMDKWRDRMKAAGLDFKPNESDHTITLPWNGAVVVGLSAEQNPYAAAGPTWSAFFIDEAQGVPDVVYQKLRPGLDIRRSRLFSFGTPDILADQTWFEGLFLRGQMPDQPRYHSFTLPVTRNPWMDEETIVEAMESNITEEAFRMLYLGQWVQLASKVFRWPDIDRLARPKQLLAPRAGHSYVAGLDVAQTHDYSVLYIMDAETREVVWWWRKSRLDYGMVRDVVVEACKLFNVTVVTMENNGPGAPLRDFLQVKGVPVNGIDLGNKNKGEIIERLVADTQFNRIGIPEDRQLVAELKAYLRKGTPSGKMSYEAPDGFFDDCVIALAYAAEGARKNGVLVVDSYASWGSRSSLANMGRRVA